MSGHRTAQDLDRGSFTGQDPGDTKTIAVDRYNARIPLTLSASAETRDLIAPVKEGQRATVVVDVAGGGVCTVTVNPTSGTRYGFDQSLLTTVAMSVAGEFVTFESIKVGSEFAWTVSSYEGTDLQTLARRRSAIQGAPETAIATATLTTTQVLGGILVGTPTATAAYTLPSGTALKAALPTNWAVNDCFDLFVINLGGAGDIITMTASTGISIVGAEEVDDDGADITNSGHFRFRYTAANTFVAYRVA